MEKEKITPEEIEKIRAGNVKKTLESKFIQTSIGANSVKSNPFLYGQLGANGGKASYLESMMSEDADKVRKNLYTKKIQEQQELGISEDPVYPSNYDVMVNLKKQLMEVQDIAKIGELEEHAKTVGAKLDFEVPEELKNYSRMEIIQKYLDHKTGRVDLNKANEQEKDALQMHALLTDAYERAVALTSCQTNYFNDFSDMGKKICDKYKKEEQTPQNS